jgi:stage II sporulation protein D
MRWAGRIRRSGLVVVAVLATGCTVAGPAPGDPTPPRRPPAPVPPAAPAVAAPTAEPGLRVGVRVDVESVGLTATGPFEVVDEAGRVRARGEAGQVWTLSRSGAGVQASTAGDVVRTEASLVFRPAGARGSAGSATIRVDDRAYRGAVLLRPARAGVTVINVLDLEAYLLGVVPLEIGANRPAEELEAVKAQAVAARTYAIRHLGRREDQGFDLYATVMDQAYGGADAEDPVSTRAVRETRGEIVVHDGAPIEAYYHSTCGGRTAALEEVWPGEPRPYLQSVSDARPGGGWYCETSNRFRWMERWDRDALRAALSQGLGERRTVDGPVSRVDFLALVGRTRSGRAEALVVRTDAGDDRVRGDSIRWVLRPEPNRILNSAAITVHTHGDDQVTALLVEGQGWGHGIGMCQVGALGRSRDGHSYREILSAYYAGTQLVRLYQ